MFTISAVIIINKLNISAKFFLIIAQRIQPTLHKLPLNACLYYYHKPL